MSLDWGSLLVVLVVSFAAAVAVLVLVSYALVAFSPKTGTSADGAAGTSAAASGGAPAIGWLCLVASAVIVLYGLYVIVA